MRSPDTQKPGATLRVWDPFVRLFHWSLVGGMAAAWFTSSIRSDTHQWIGLGVAALVGLRIVWGFAGSRHARFANFIKGPRVVLNYIGALAWGTERRYLGHNPAGGAMILVLLTDILITVLTGWLMTTDAWYGDDAMQLAHSAFAYSVVGLVIFHLGGVALASLRHRENLVRAMVTGQKRAPAPEDVA
ncbi:MAG: cytochrome b/b6 domain-containing protein [Alphaproteobacteria bacterium]|nr:cytochrome b/b6 domain-containing protein [Alphaproteobacteria bacterium]